LTPDPLAGLVALALADAQVEALAAGRVYGDELPDSEAAGQPRKAVTIRHAGMSTPAPEVGSKAELASYRFDVWNFGETHYEAGRMRLATFDVLRGLERAVFEGVLFHSAIREAGPLSLRDASTNWPFKLETWRVLVSCEEVTTT
jgi:hypothetical protein